MYCFLWHGLFYNSLHGRYDLGGATCTPKVICALHRKVFVRLRDAHFPEPYVTDFQTIAFGVKFCEHLMSANFEMDYHLHEFKLPTSTVGIEQSNQFPPTSLRRIKTELYIPRLVSLIVIKLKELSLTCYGMIIFFVRTVSITSRTFAEIL